MQVLNDKVVTFGSVVAFENQLKQFGIYFNVPMMSQGIIILPLLHCLLYLCLEEVRPNGIDDLQMG